MPPKAAKEFQIKDRAPFKEIFNQTDMFIYSMMTFVVCMHTSAVAKCGNFGVKRTLVEHFVKFFKADCVEPVPLCLKMIVDCIFHAHPTFKSKAPLTETEVAVIRSIQTLYPRWSKSPQTNVPEMLKTFTETIIWPYFYENVAAANKADEEHKNRVFKMFCKFTRAFSEQYSFLPSYSIYHTNYEIFLAKLDKEVFGDIDRIANIRAGSYVKRIINSFEYSSKHRATAEDDVEESDAEKTDEEGSVDDDQLIKVAGDAYTKRPRIDDDGAGSPLKRVKISVPAAKKQPRHITPSIVDSDNDADDDEDEEENAANDEDQDRAAFQALSRFPQKDYKVANSCQLESVSVLVNLLQAECKKF